MSMNDRLMITFTTLQQIKYLAPKVSDVSLAFLVRENIITKEQFTATP